MDCIVWRWRRAKFRVRWIFGSAKAEFIHAILHNDIPRVGYMMILGATHRINPRFDLSRNSDMREMIYILNQHVNIFDTYNLMAIAKRAAFLRYFRIIDFFISMGFNIHGSHEYIFRRACELGDMHLVKHMLKNGADIHVLNDSAVRMAAFYGHFELVVYLASQGADVHASNDYATRWASERMHFEIVQYLVIVHGAPSAIISNECRRYMSIYVRGQKRRRIKAANRIYFWWIPKCHQLSTPGGIRICLQNLEEYETLYICHKISHHIVKCNV
jgi:hypothetical protein